MRCVCVCMCVCVCVCVCTDLVSSDYSIHARMMCAYACVSIWCACVRACVRVCVCVCVCVRACVCVQGLLHVLNLGDSGLHLIRNGVSVFQTNEQQHYFNCPFQLGMGLSSSHTHHTHSLSLSLFLSLFRSP